MSKKSPRAIRELHKEYSKPQITRWEKQHKTQRIIFFSGIGLIVAVLLLVGGGWYFTQYRILVTPLVTVNGTNIRVIDFIKVLRASGVNSSTSSTDLDNTVSYVISTLEQSTELQQAAATINESVTHDQVVASLKANKESTDLYPIELLNLLYNQVQTDYFTKQVPTTADQRDVEAMFLESEQQADDFINQLNQTSSSDDFTTKFDALAKTYSLETYSQTNSGEIGNHPQAALSSTLGSSVPSDYAFSSERGILSQPRPDTTLKKQVGYWLIYDIENGTGDNAGKVNVGVMLLSSEEQAQNIKSQLDAITDPTALSQQFSELAKKYSQYTNASTDGGLLGYISTGTLGTTFDNVAFSMNSGAISDAVKDTTQTTTGGYWLIKVIGISNNSTVSSADIDSIASSNFSTWWTQQTSAAKIVDHTSDTVSGSSQTLINWAENKVISG